MGGERSRGGGLGTKAEKECERLRSDRALGSHGRLRGRARALVGKDRDPSRLDRSLGRGGG